MKSAEGASIFLYKSSIIGIIGTLTVVSSKKGNLKKLWFSWAFLAVPLSIITGAIPVIKETEVFGSFSIFKSSIPVVKETEVFGFSTIFKSVLP